MTAKETSSDTPNNSCSSTEFPERKQLISTSDCLKKKPKSCDFWAIGSIKLVRTHTAVKNTSCASTQTFARFDAKQRRMRPSSAAWTVGCCKGNLFSCRMYRTLRFSMLTTPFSARYFKIRLVTFLSWYLSLKKSQTSPIKHKWLSLKQIKHTRQQVQPLLNRLVLADRFDGEKCFVDDRFAGGRRIDNFYNLIFEWISFCLAGNFDALCQ